jgi:hypothetical protein
MTKTSRLASAALLLLSAALSACELGDPLGAVVDEINTTTQPDESLTPGSLCTADHLDFDGYRYAEQVPHCKRRVSKATRRLVFASYGVPTSETGSYEVDHRISLSLGGDNSVDNLWPLYQPAAREKAHFEQWLYYQLSGGEMSQAEAITAVLDWR